LEAQSKSSNCYCRPWRLELHQRTKHPHWCFIAASAREIGSPSQAEAQALLLAANFAAAMNLSNPMFFIHLSQIWLKLQRIQECWSIHALVNQEACNLIPEHHLVSTKIFHISKEIYDVAHNCAHQAKRSLRSTPTRSCRNSAHSNHACLDLAVKFVILDIQCLLAEWNLSSALHL
jgi:hypothetical protein